MSLKWSARALIFGVLCIACDPQRWPLCSCTVEKEHGGVCAATYTQRPTWRGPPSSSATFNLVCGSKLKACAHTYECACHPPPPLAPPPPPSAPVLR
jgi:hypothetical protein